ncbi:MAG: mechanosensitive ion channel family protein [Betaproteobacteria bacterium]|nr:mechanosensitive ion channel family protein [Betaproteobacteria bacterium]
MMSSAASYAMTLGALALGALLAILRPSERHHVRNALLLVVVLAVMLAAGDAASARGHGRLGDAFSDLAAIGIGVSILRLSALLVFRAFLPMAGFPAPRILADMVSAMLYAVWGYLWLRMSGIDPSSLVTTSAVITAVVAFSMQDTLGNVLGGVALQLDSSIRVGDWVKVDDVSGQVVDIRWRYTAIETRNRETVFVPNSYLMKNRFTVVGSREEEHVHWRRWLWFDVDLEANPAEVCDALEQAVLDAHIAHVSREPRPSAVLMSLSDGYGRYALRYWLTDARDDDSTDSQVRMHAHAALVRRNIRLSIPHAERTIIKENEARRTARRLEDLAHKREALKRVYLFATLTEAEIDTLAGHLVHAPFLKGDVMTRQGAVAHWLYIVISGQAEVSVETREGSTPIAVIESGGVFGEMGMLTGEARRATVTAITDVDCYRLDKTGFQSILRARPDLGEEVTRVLAKRNAELSRTVGQLQAAAHPPQVSDLLSRMRTFFGLNA